MIAAFADTYYFVALLNRQDEGHARAHEMGQDLRTQLVTTEYILVETADAFATTRLRGVIRDFIELAKRSPNVRLVPASDALFSAGLKLYADRPDKGWSLTDCISFAVMKQKHLKDALTADRHFAQAGFRILF